jgi:hypothetical protein
MGNKTSGVGKAWQVALTELREGLVGNPLKSIIEVIAGGRRGWGGGGGGGGGEGGERERGLGGG